MAKKTKKEKALLAFKERERYQKNRWKILEARRERHEIFKAKKDLYKRTLECSNPNCNRSFQDNPKKCEFHHLNPTEKSFSPHKATTWMAFLREVGKCVPLCSDCHSLVEVQKKKRYRRLAEEADPVPF